MIRHILFISLSILLFSCSTEPELKEEVEIVKIEPTIPEEDTFPYDTLQGMYVGDFGGSDIRIIINYCSQKNAIGYNIHKGLQRNINGKVERHGDSITLILQEPGDNEFDGVFTLLFKGIDNVPAGNWTSNSGKIPAKNFTLEKMIAPDREMEGEIGPHNFSQYYGYLSDENGSYNFKKDGLCVYEYYPETDDKNRVEQLVEILGSWSLEGNQVIVEWQPNNHFGSRRMVYTMEETEYYGEGRLIGEDGTELYPHFW